MNESHDDRKMVYEIGYLIATSIPEEQVPAEADKIKKIINDAGAVILAEEAPHLQPLAYTMRKKMVSGAYDKYDEAHFGWVKFEMSSNKVEEAKKAIEVLPTVLRMLLITTVRENTYLGKRTPSMTAKVAFDEKVVVAPSAGAVIEGAQAPVTVEEMDKSIDDMVKEV